MRPITVIVLGILAGFAAFFTARVTHSESLSPPSDPDFTPRIAEAQVSKVIAARPDDADPAPPISNAYSDAKLDEILAEPGYLLRRTRLRVLFDALSIDRYADVLAAIKGTPRATAECLQLFFLSWLRQDATAAMARAQETLSGELLPTFRQILSFWANREPEAARKFAVGLSETERKPFLAWLDKKTTEPKPSNVTERNFRKEFMRHIQIDANGMHLGLDYQNVTLPAFRRWVQAEPKAAAEEILRSPMMRKADFLGIIFEEWSKTDRRAAESFFASLNTKEQHDMITPMAIGLAEKDPAAARTLAERLPATGNWRESVMTEIGKKMAERDPASAQVWIESIRHTNPEFLPMSLFAIWFKHDPNAAAKALLESPAYLAHRSNGKDLTMVAQYLDLSDWVRKDPGHATEFIAALPPRDSKSTLIKLGEKWVQQDAAAALDWARTLPAGTLQDEALRQFTFVWAKSSNREVVAHLQRLPHGSGKSAAIEGFAFASFDNDPDQVLQWTRQIHDPAMRLDVLSRAWSDWRRKNRAGADDWADNVAALDATEREALEARR